MITMQEAYDKAKDGVLAQCTFSRTTLGACKYYTADGVYCGIGHLLPDDATRQKWDRLDDTAVTEQPIHRLEEAGLAHLSIDFLQDLQNAHDDARTLPDFEARMTHVAKAWKLKP